MSGLTLDAGALIAFERLDRRVVGLLRKAVAASIGIAVPAGVIGQVWRGGARQARLAQLLRSPGITIEALDEQRARMAGQLCGLAGASDVIDASVVLCARARGHTVLTSDPDDLRRLDGSVRLEII